MRILWQRSTSLDNNNNIVGFPDNSNDNISSKFKEKITAK